MDKGCPDTGAAGQGAGLAGHGALQLLVGPCAVAVASRGLVQDVGHAGRSRESSVPLTGRGGPAGPAWAKGAQAVTPGSWDGGRSGAGRCGGTGQGFGPGARVRAWEVLLGGPGNVEMWAHGLETPSIWEMGEKQHLGTQGWCTGTQSDLGAQLGFQGHRWGRTQAGGDPGAQDIHQIDADSAGRRGQHGPGLDLVVVADDASGRQVNKGCGHHPDGQDRGQSTQCLCGVRPISTTQPGPGGPLDAPLSSPERCQPKVMVLVGGRLDTQREKRLTDMLPTSVSRWAASVMMARLCARYPPVGTERLAPSPPQPPAQPGPLSRPHRSPPRP